ncbi:intradiol ring-cleavage dioxygenase [Burkholderia gladioli]|uniref:Hydroxyquinol 1,2-dioxygenase n=1 Tax=Burkholderia gladioli (strain BSR3) TaxID=999541 RepID=F2LB88_BURGS|nr:intradiol ring-cleavage dioxygenase [Burkholderia gladioli]AEA60157.1 Hydroxyquinol 1,2-dioxygenase [Burkholderia gladioli BSR3]MBW5288051.1 intradiol ring-cleavage dioxygenase [Burkholderia gladioli]
MSSREFTITDEAIARMQPKNERFGVVMTSLIRHLHNFVRDVELTNEEWMTAIEFLTKAGQMCTDKRQEFILLSDTLGVSILVDAINNRFPDGAIEQTVLGPYYWQGAPELPMGSDLAKGIVGEPCFYSGRMLTLEGQPLEGALLDIWSGDGEGNYDMQLESEEMRARGRLTTGADGKYWFRSIKPFYYPVPTDGPVGAMLEAMGRHPNRPGHIHFIVSAPGYKTVITHLFPSDTPYLDSDAVFGVKKSLIVDFKRHEAGLAPTGEKVDVPFWTCEYDFHLVPSDKTALQNAA